MEKSNQQPVKKENQNLAQKAKKGVVWTILKSLTGQGSRLIASFILARLLFPEDFGIYGIALIVYRFANRLGNFGFAQVLVQKNLIDDRHIRTTFTINMLIAVFTTAVVYFLAPFFADLVTKDKDAHLIPVVAEVIQLISLNFVIISLYAVPNSLLKRELKFKQESIISIFANMVKFLSPLAFAYFNYGVWSIVYGLVLGEIIHTLAFYIYTRWVPKVGLYKAELKDIFSFGIWMNMYSYVQYFYKNAPMFFVGKFLGLEMLGYYERAFSLMSAPRKRVSDMINSVLFATYSKIQDEEERLISAMKKVMSAIAFVIFPAMTVIFFTAESLIPLFYGPGWEVAIVPLKIMALSSMIESVTMVYYPIFLAKGLVKRRTKAHTIVMVFLLISVFFASQDHINTVALAIVGVSIIGLLINTREYMKVSKWRWKFMFSSLKPALIISAIMAIVLQLTVLGLNPYFEIHSPFMFLIISFVAAIAFFVINYLFKFGEIKEVFKLLLGKKFKKVEKYFN